MNREKIEKLVDGVLEVTPDVWDNPNGGYQYTCPYCLAHEEVKGGEYVSMSELKHDGDCIYLLPLDIKNDL